VDWRRRYDHMQQHSAQHLISAVCDRSLGFHTVSWWLAQAPQDCHIELDTPNMTDEQKQTLQDAVNDCIRAALPMTVHICSSLNEV